MGEQANFHKLKGKDREMKRILILIVSQLLIAGNFVGAGDWGQVQLPEVSNKWGLSGISFATPDNGWAVGTDFADVGIIKAVTRGIILHYQEGKWIQTNAPEVSSNWNLNKVYFVTLEDGWAVGHDKENKRGVLLHFTNGEWNFVELPTVNLEDWTLLDLYFLDESEGWAVGGSPKEKGAVILHYKDGSWTPEGNEELLKGHLLRVVDANSADDVWFGGQREGHLWGIMAHDRPWGTYEVHYNGEWSEVKQPLLLRNVVRTDYYFFRPNDGWVIGFLPAEVPKYLGKMAHWNGKKWKAEKLPKISNWWNLEAVDFSSPKYGWAVGINSSKNCGVLIEYKKKKWTPIKKKKLPNVSKDWWLKDVVYDGSNDWWAVGTDGKDNKGIILRYSP